jgi:transposase
MNTKKKQPSYSGEFRDRAVRLVEEQQKVGLSQWAAMQSISQKLGCTPETLHRWVRQVEQDQGKRPGLSSAEAEELKQLRRENKELERANEILRTASAYFAQAELDRRQR